MYGTFDELSEVILQKKINLRQASQHLIDPSYPFQLDNSLIYKQSNNNVLILDEVDTFFGEQSYGKTHNIAIKVQSPEIEQILREVWQQGKPRSKDGKSLVPPLQIYNTILETQNYQKIVKKYPNLKRLLELHIQDMCQAVCNINNHEYICQDNKIGYKMADHSISYNITYKYNTIFAYFKENQTGQIFDEKLKEMLAIQFNCGRLSFAEIPKQYKYIFGVTGTLECLHDDMKQILKEYKIEKQTFIPTIFLPSNYVFNIKSPDNFSVEPNKNNQFQKIQLVSKHHIDKKQAVLIFFDSKQQLQQYLNSNQLVMNKKDYLVITEESQNKDILIKQSTRSGQITLVTKDYGRGTDFICYDDIVQENGGVVVIQTFYSIDISEQKQIMGRTGRQSQKAIYCLILNQEDLIIDLDITKETLQEYKEQDNLYERLDYQRQKVYGQFIQNYKDRIPQAKESNDETINYINSLIEQQDENALKLFIQMNLREYPIKNIVVQQKQHIIIILDQSGSMRQKDDGIQTRWELQRNAYENLIKQKLFSGESEHIVTVIYHSHVSKIVADQQPISQALEIVKNNNIQGGGNDFSKAINLVYDVLSREKSDYKQSYKQILFLSDGGDRAPWENLEKSLNNLKSKYQQYIGAFWVLGFGPKIEKGVLQKMKEVMEDCRGELKTALDQEELNQQFIEFSSQEPQQI